MTTYCCYRNKYGQEEPRRATDEYAASRVDEVTSNREEFNIHKNTHHQDNEESSDIKVVNTTRSRGGSVLHILTDLITRLKLRSILLFNMTTPTRSMFCKLNMKYVLK